MVADFSTSLCTPVSGRRTALILDHFDYAQRVILRGGPVPWTEVGEFVNFFGQAQGLLRPDAALVDLGRFYRHLIEARPKLRTTMCARSRVGYALKTLLADEQATAAAVAVMTAVGLTSRVPVIVQIPSPLTWLAQLDVQVGVGDPSRIDVDHGENLAVYVADWLRSLAELPISVLLMDARRTEYDMVPQDNIGLYSPIRNTAEHYRWWLALRGDNRVSVAGKPIEGAVVPIDYWSHQDITIPAADFLVAEIPAETAPETVLTGLSGIA